MKKTSIPTHIAIIMDGNGRWAKAKNVPKLIGYQKGIKVAQNIIEYSKYLGIRYLTLYAFSLENWQRPKKEVEELMQIFKFYLRKELRNLINQDIKIIFIGNHSKLDEDIRNLMSKIEKKSLNNKFHLIIAISYSARNEIIEAITTLYKKNQSILNNKCNIENRFESVINPHNIPNPDLLIRTSGEKRLSNFLLWQIAYTELYFTNKPWPAFSKCDLIDAINDFNKRERTYGK